MIRIVVLAAEIASAMARMTWKLSVTIFKWKYKPGGMELLKSDTKALAAMFPFTEKVYWAVAELHKRVVAMVKCKIIEFKIRPDELVNRYAQELYEETQGLNAYQIQERCFHFSEKELPGRLKREDRAYFDTVRSVALQYGFEADRLLDLATSIPLRDKVLSIAGIPQQEIEIHTPKDAEDGERKTEDGE